MVMGAACGLFLIPFFTKKEDSFRREATRTTSRWMLYWLPSLVGGALIYWMVVPTAMIGNLPVANGTQAFAGWYEHLRLLIIVAAGTAAMVALVGAFARLRIPALVSLVPFLLLVALLGHFERVREFIRKPYAIGGYLYANGIRADDYPLLQEEGLLAHSTYATVKRIDDSNRVQAGKEVFNMACSRCHTINGINSIQGNLETMYGSDPWDASQIAGYVQIMHTTRGYMPPFPGNDEERLALAAYLVYLQQFGDTLAGAQHTGIAVDH